MFFFGCSAAVTTLLVVDGALLLLNLYRMYSRDRRPFTCAFHGKEYGTQYYPLEFGRVCARCGLFQREGALPREIKTIPPDVSKHNRVRLD
jgi:hypothetical protein